MPRLQLSVRMFGLTAGEFELVDEANARRSIGTMNLVTNDGDRANWCLEICHQEIMIPTPWEAVVRIAKALKCNPDDSASGQMNRSLLQTDQSPALFTEEIR